MPEPEEDEEAAEEIVMLITPAVASLRAAVMADVLEATANELGPPAEEGESPLASSVREPSAHDGPLSPICQMKFDKCRFEIRTNADLSIADLSISPICQRNYSATDSTAA